MKKESMIPHEFILDLLCPLPIRTKKMFGNLAIYYGDKIVLATRQKEENKIDNGIWIGTKIEHHDALKNLVPELRHLETYKIKKWLLLHEDESNFEERAQQIVQLIKEHSELIGIIPKPRKKKQL
ncbi:hypothetical protein [Aquimarina litoralis]|uniref:hypothetical protein n=1 Tax=Aquimarina litoralis TaxID=584605 RepID=UPI001C565855|nr:hypothetical protein [Aquimarina litoralis]MBW1296709.1 hypothetical protein [Aquimarina litoralis]